MSTTTVQDRDYQFAARDRVFEEWGRGVQNTLVVLPTGTGKTLLAGMIARKAKDEQGRRTLFLAHREELVNQAADKISRFDLDCAVEMADQRARENLGLIGKPDVVVGTVQTLQKYRLMSWDPAEFGVIMTDEAHHARAKTYRTIYDHFKGYVHLGITATPDRGDQKNLGAVYETIAYDYPLREAIKAGWLVPLTTARLTTSVDLNNIRTTGGDFNAKDLEERISPHIEELARAIVAEVGTRPTVVFTPDVGSAEAMADALTQLGLAAECVSGRMPKQARRDTLARYTRGELQVLCCCDLLTEGWDEPQVACIVICRPTRKRNRYAQMIGRGTRPHTASGKVDCLVIDFAWETTSGHELCCTVDLFDDSTLDDEVIDLAKELAADREKKAKKIAEQTGEPVERIDPRDLIEEAEKILTERRKFRVKLTGRTPRYQKFVYDPVGVGSLLGVRIKAGWDFNSRNPASDKQLNFLRKLGVDSPNGLSKQGAGKLIEALKGRLDQHMATPKQVGFMINLGVLPGQAREMSFEQAHTTINDLLAMKRRA